MSASLRWTGLEELKQLLRDLPDDLTGEASHIIDARSNAAAADVRLGYAEHRQTGDLIDGVYVSRFDRGRYSTIAIVKSAAPHAWIFEHGTQARHTDAGWNRGAAPPHNVFVPAMERQRRLMYDDFKDMLVRHGLGVR